MEDVRAIRRIVAAINEAWRTGEYESIGEHVAEHVVMAPPGQDTRILGRAAYVASFRQYAEVAKTHQFSPATPRVDVVGNTAVAVCRFSIVYEIEGSTYSEKGSDILVFARTGEGWKIVWRTLTSEPQELPA
jgi:ketosteroid isomerase-like protein